MPTRDSILVALSHAAPDRLVEEYGRKARLVCPNPDHSGGRERSPSFYVTLEGKYAGSARCFGCGITPTWREVVAMLDLPRSARFLSEDVASTTTSDDEAAAMTGRVAKRESGSLPWPRDQNWRRVDGRLLAELGGQLVPSRRGPALLRLPVLMRGERLGHVDCALDKPITGDLAYVNSAGKWAQHALYPYDFVRSRSPDVVAVVEGTRDALVTIQNGLPAVAVLGSTNWSSKCAESMLRIGAGVVVVMADPDDAGERLRRAVYSSLSSRTDVRSVVLPSEIVDGKRVKLKDPADLDARQLDLVLKKIGIEKSLYRR